MKDVQGHSPAGNHLFPVAAACMFVKNPPGKTEIALITQLEALFVTRYTPKIMTTVNTEDLTPLACMATTFLA